MMIDNQVNMIGSGLVVVEGDLLENDFSIPNTNVENVLEQKLVWDYDKKDNHG